MDRLERLLDLVHVLQTAREPVPLSTLRERFADYGEGSEESIRRKFERDKAELAGIGLVLRYVDGEDVESGYLLDAEASYLPSLELGESDRAVLATAARAALADSSFPHRRALRLALAKLGASPDEADPTIVISHGSAEDGDEGRVEALGAALAARKRVKLVHRKPRSESTEREVDPYGLFLRAGAWYLVGFDHRSKDVRFFMLSRIESASVNTKKPGTPDFDVPDDFELRPRMDTSPLHYDVHPTVCAQVRVDPDVVFLMERAWGAATDGVFEIETENLDYLIDQVLSLGKRAELLSPPHARERVVQALRAVLRAQLGATEPQESERV